MKRACELHELPLKTINDKRMNNYDFPIGADCNWAPWNQPESEVKTEPECPNCEERDRLEDETPIESKTKYWYCLSCGTEFSSGE